jgi:glycerol-3-phosphate acyltransferase PlsY
MCGYGDIRLQGSGNIGATNVRRIAGNRLGVLTLLADVAKGAVPVVAGRMLLASPACGWGEAYLAFVLGLALAGHLYPLYTRLRQGGKGVATFLGGVLALYPLAVLVALLVFILLLCMWGRASIGSLGTVAFLPLAVWYASASGVMTAAVAAYALWIITRHRDNLRRLWQGREPRSI